MTLYNSRRRFLKSIAMTAVLAGVYVCFRLVTAPFLDVEPKKHKARGAGAASVAASQVESDAGKWFPNHSWVKEAQEQYFDHGRFLYCNSSELINDGMSIILKPVAIRWTDEDHDDSEVPITLVADSAQLNLGNAISENDTQIGRVTGGFISGKVQINGPHGLRIIGHTFNLAEDSMRLWSSEQIQFAWEGHRGTAASGVDIYLQASEQSGGLTKVDEVSRIQLNGRVNCLLNIPARRRNEDDIDLRISAAQGFAFDVATKTGTFSGLIESTPRAGAAERPLKASEQVWVRQLNPLDAKQTLNQLVCPELVTTFRNRISKETGKPLPRKIELENIRAWGRRVVFLSEEHGVLVDGNDFQYAIDEQRIDIRNTPDGVTNRQKFVKVLRDNAELTVPHIRILHTAKGGGVRRVECNGRGLITGRTDQLSATEQPDGKPAGSASVFGASWLQSLVLQVSEDEKRQVVTLRGSASVSQADRDMKLSGQQIQMKLLGSEAEAVSSDSGASAAATGIDFGSLQPEILVATDAVSLDSPQGHGQLREKLTVRFETVPHNPVQTVSASGTDAEGDRDGLPTESKDQVSFVADTLEATVKVSQAGDSRSAEFQNVWLKGDVEVVRQSDKPENSFTAIGNQLFAANGLNNNRQIQLFGDPAKVVSETRNLEGPRIDLTELDRKAEVVGSGRIRFMTTSGLDGRPLPEPTPLDIYWSDRMHFQKRSAEFVGNIRVVMSDGVTQDLQLLCSGMTVHFSRDIALGERDADGGFEAFARSGSAKSDDDSGPIERIECHNRVTVHVEQFAEGVVSARHNAVFADLNVNLMTGDFHAIGPGSLESVSPDKNGELQGSAPVTARANTSAQTAETAFVHVKTAFIGELTGNLHRREANLSQNVLALVTPTRRVDEKINVQQIPRDDLPERAGILRAEKLTISAVEESAEESSASSSQMFSIVARTNARLESRSIAASADIITYDHAKEQFIIRADGTGNVTVHHRSGPGGRFNRFSGNRFEYYRRTNRLKAKEIDGLNLGE